LSEVELRVRIVVIVLIKKLHVAVIDKLCRKERERERQTEKENERERERKRERGKGRKRKREGERERKSALIKFIFTSIRLQGTDGISPVIIGTFAP